MSVEVEPFEIDDVGNSSASCDVLVVEDDQSIRTMIVETLVDEGYRVAAAVHGDDALRRLTTGLPRLIILDIMMPVMDGNTFCHQLQADVRLRAIPIILMSAAHNLQLLPAASQVVGLLRKPFMLTTLLQHVEGQISLG